ncbi:uncharacterized protein LOC121706650 [Alosa sapidissima]|uniref:uncharacterized protein LOC121706650 n=1 Tax=Alosa sapidissima TaxID=34773 RepID=UPI001C09C2E2|nr:uncharacterized protein LOC121706650 [Alosa sapidissima]
MSSYNLLDFQVSDSDDDDPVPPANVRRSSRVLTRDSPWLNHPSEQILELLEKQGIPVKSGTPREDLLSMALSILGTPSISDQEDIASPEAPAQPKKASRKRPAKPPPSQPGKRAYKAPTRPQSSASQIQTSPASDQSIVDAILSLTSTVKGLEARMEAFERPSTSTPAASLNISAFSHAPLPSTSSFLPAAFRPPAHSAGAPLTEAFALAGLHTFNLVSALPAQDPGRRFVSPAAATLSPIMRSHIIQGVSQPHVYPRVSAFEYHPSFPNHHQFGPCSTVQGVGSAPAVFTRQDLRGSPRFGSWTEDGACAKDS